MLFKLYVNGKEILFNYSHDIYEYIKKEVLHTEENLDLFERMKNGEFEEGTILPKIEAAIDFIGNSAIRKAIITKLDAAKKTLGGTVIHK